MFAFLLSLIPLMESLLKNGVDVIYVSQGDTQHRDGHVIVINTEFLYQLESSAELKAAILKRFHGKTTRYTYPTFRNLVHWVLSSNEYNIREANMSCVSDDDITEVWEFIDTIKVSSSEACRSMISTMIRSRDRESFRRAVGYPRTAPRARVRGAKIPRKPPAIIPVGNTVQGVHSTIDAAVLEDTLHMAITSPDPLGACRSIGASIRGWR